ncbi:hypothetical protein [Alkalimarinus coralli]|uniref:hypothetical protein n=1 Tax=Alkalimarinus coralli TaxID=2935863 RepID=UPI00202AEC51|nr:hypothetical protein [Alkalimarinus coralli]
MLDIIQWVSKVLTPKWAYQKKPDPEHFYRRRFTKQYSRRKKTVKNIWIVSGFMMLAFPLIQFIVPTLLFTSFVAFCILDET